MGNPYDDAAMTAFLNDLTLLCLKHGLYIDTSQAEDRYDLPNIEPVDQYFQGYAAHNSSGLKWLMKMPSQFVSNGPESVNLGEMSAHERLAFVASAKGVVMP